MVRIGDDDFSCRFSICIHAHNNIIHDELRTYTYCDTHNDDDNDDLWNVFIIS